MNKNMIKRTTDRRGWSMVDTVQDSVGYSADSRKKNDSMDTRQARRRQRERMVWMQKCLIVTVIIVVILLAILCGTRIRILADSANKTTLHTYYTSIELQAGDTIWDLAQEYTAGTRVSTQDYIAEVCRLNHLTDADDIHAGGNLVIPYYSYEEK